MRRVLQISLSVGLVLNLAGCTVDNPGGIQNEPMPILFQTPVVGAATKTDAGYANHEMPTSYNTAEHFSVYATDGTVPFASLTAAQKSHYYMNNEECAYVAGYNAWAPLTLFYWLPSVAGDFYLNFQAYSPSVAQEDCSSIVQDWDNGLSFNGFTPRDPGSQYDLLYSDRHLDKKRPDYTPGNAVPYDETTGDAGSYSGIDICFHHALSSIVFKVMAKVSEDAIQTIHLQKITVKNAWNKGSFDQGTGLWSIDSDAAETDYVVYQNTGSVTDGLRLYEDLGLITVGNALMLIPQTLLHPGDPLDPGIPDDDRHILIEITYTRTIVATGKTVTAVETADLVNGNENGYYQDTTSGTPVDIDRWERGRRYTYNITLNLYKVFVDPQVTGWNDFTPGQDMNL